MLENKKLIYKFRPNFWEDIMLDLSKYKGDTINLGFSVPYHSKIGGNEPQYVALLGNPRLNPIRNDDKPNVILIVLDALRSDHLGCYGYPLDTSANIDEFARNSILFENVVAAAPNTIMSHRSIFTGLYTSESGFNLIGEYKNGRFLAPLMHTITPKVMTMADYLQSNGYYTAAFTGSVWMSAMSGFDKGFSEYSEIKKPKLDMSKEVRWVVKWLKDHKDFKFFLFFHTYEIHSPYTKTSFLKKLDEYPANLARKDVIARYDSGIFYADNCIAELIKELKNLSLFDNTIIIITSDHGERFDLTPEELKLHVHSGTHGDTLYNCELKVPLIIGGWSKLRGRVRLQNQIRNIDILPTVLDWLDIPLKDSITGQSLIPLIDTNKKLDRLAYSETSKNFPNPETLMYSLQSSDRKIIKYINLPIGGVEKNKSSATTFEFFNLLADKTEKNDLSVRDPLYKKYLSILEMTIAKCAKKYRINMSETSKISVHDEQLENNLRQLGYLN
jgi:arylsulfatase A-like enzyme